MTDQYHPTPLEVVALRPKEGYLKLSGDRIFATRQGEGATAGMNAVFIRLHFCNLACGREGGWICDTGHTWDKRTKEFWQEPTDMTPPQLAMQVRQSWLEAFKNADGHRAVITGGEPLLQQENIVELIRLLPDWAIEIETNGTITPVAELSNCQFNCSPKLANSGNSLNRRFRPDVLRNIALLPNSWFKFVVTKESDLDEIDQIANECNLPSNRILIMPEGREAQKIATQADLLFEEVKRRGYKITLRNQLVWFGDKRGT